jgi:CBS domain-containing protein
LILVKTTASRHGTMAASGGTMKVAEVCTRELVMADQEASLQQAATLMRERHVGTLLVSAQGADGLQAVGIVTDRDVVIEAVARGLDVTRTPVGRLAEGKLAVVPADSTLDQAIEAMKARGVRRLLVAGADGAVQGIVSLDDLVDAVAHELSGLARVARAGIEREAAEREPLPAAQPPQTIRVPVYSYV